MASTPATTAPSGSSSKFGFLARKIGPVPIWLIALAIIGVAYWYEKYGPGASSGSSSSAAGTDPATGESYAAELAAADQQIQDLQTTGTPGATGPAGPAGPAGTSGVTTVPAVTGQRRETAEANLTAAGLTSTTTGVTPKANTGYHVTAQSPAAGQTVAKGTAVTLTIAEDTKKNTPALSVGKGAVASATNTTAAAVAPQGMTRWRNAA